MQVRDVLVVVPFFLCFIYITARKTRRKLPPGPPGWPVVGNTFDIPRHEPWTQYARLSQRYGTLLPTPCVLIFNNSRRAGSDIVSFKILGSPLILLSSAEAAMALLEKRSNVYSDRYVLGFVCRMGGAHKWCRLMTTMLRMYVFSAHQVFLLLSDHW